MKKLIDVLFGSHTIFTLFTVAIVMVVVTAIELRIFNIPNEYSDGIWLSNIVLALIIYFVSSWLNKPE